MRMSACHLIQQRGILHNLLIVDFGSDQLTFCVYCIYIARTKYPGHTGKLERYHRRPHAYLNQFYILHWIVYHFSLVC